MSTVMSPNIDEKKSEDTNTQSYLSRLNTAFDADDELFETNRKNSHYYYSAGDFHFILDNSFKPETLEMQALTKVPFMPSWHAGIISIHGLIMPVIELFGFLKIQNIPVQAAQYKKQYLLKLDHKSYRSIVFKLDALPQLINTLELKELSTTSQDSPEWIKHYLENGSTKIAIIDHQKFFDQIIHTQ